MRQHLKYIYIYINAPSRALNPMIALGGGFFVCFCCGFDALPIVDNTHIGRVCLHSLVLYIVLT